MADQVSKRYISLPHVVGLTMGVVALYTNVLVHNNRHTKIASGIMSQLIVVGDKGTEGHGMFGGNNERGVDFYVDGICIHGNLKNGVIATDCSLDNLLCGGDEPAGGNDGSAKPCWLAYKDPKLEAVTDCTQVKNTAKVATLAAKNNFVFTDTDAAPVFTATSNEIVRSGGVKGKACILAGCKAGTGAACAKLTTAIKDNTPVLSANVLAAFRHGLVYKKIDAEHFAINVVKAKATGTGSATATTTQQSEHAFGVSKYAHGFSQYNLDLPLLWTISAAVMVLGALLVLTTKWWPSGKYGGAQGEGFRGLHPYWPSTILDIAHFAFLALNVTFMILVGQNFAVTIKGSFGDPVIEMLFWAGPIILLVGQSYVFLHGVIFAYMWASRAKGERDPYNNSKGMKLSNAKFVIKDHEMAERASMVRNNLNV